jgi:RNA polymerase sigma-70 factor (ECF subfamily)
MNSEQWQAEQFERSRSHLHDVAQKMLGSHAEADDAVQEAWLRLNRADTSQVENLRGWLTTVVSRICLDMLRARQARHEELVDTWPPEVILTETGHDPEQEALIADSVGVAMLVVLERLSPAERLAFVLHDMFGVGFEDIAPIVERSVPATRQLASRARRRVRGGDGPRPETRAEQQRIVNAFLSAARDGDFAALLEVLDPNVVFEADTGTEGPPAPPRMRGADSVARLVLARGTPMAPYGRPAIINGRPGAAVVLNGRLVSLASFTIVGERITEMNLLVDPAKLRDVKLGPRG